MIESSQIKSRLRTAFGNKAPSSAENESGLNVAVSFKTENSIAHRRRDSETLNTFQDFHVNTIFVQDCGFESPGNNEC